MQRILSTVVAFSFLLLGLTATSHADHLEADIRGTITKVRPASADEKSRFVGIEMVEADETVQVSRPRASTKQIRILG